MAFCWSRFAIWLSKKSLSYKNAVEVALEYDIIKNPDTESCI